MIRKEHCSKRKCTPFDIYWKLSRIDTVQPATIYFRAIELSELINNIEFSGRVLDIGCGNGTIGQVIKSYNKGMEVYGVDPDRNQIENCKGQNQYKELHVCGGEIIPYEDNFFDYVFSNSVLEHITDNQPIFNEVYRVLKKNGELVITVPIDEMERGLVGAKFPASCYLPNERMQYLSNFNSRTAVPFYRKENEWEEYYYESKFLITKNVSYLNSSQIRTWEFWANLTGGLMFKLKGGKRMEDIQNELYIQKSYLSMVLNLLFLPFFCFNLNSNWLDNSYGCRLFSGKKTSP